MKATLMKRLLILAAIAPVSACIWEEPGRYGGGHDDRGGQHQERGHDDHDRHDDSRRGDDRDEHRY